MMPFNKQINELPQVAARGSGEGLCTGCATQRSTMKLSPSPLRTLGDLSNIEASTARPAPPPPPTSPLRHERCARCGGVGRRVGAVLYGKGHPVQRRQRLARRVALRGGGSLLPEVLGVKCDQEAHGRILQGKEGQADFEC